MMIELSVIRDVVAIFGVIAGFSYYVIMVRNQNRTRQAQLFNQMWSWTIPPGVFEEHIELLNWDWTDYDDFEHKYGSDNNPAAFAKRMRIYGILDGIGTHVKEGLLNVSLTQSAALIAVFQWYKWKNIIEEQRKRYYTPLWLQNWEYYVNEVLKYWEKMGYPYTPPETLSKYIPDQ